MPYRYAFTPEIVHHLQAIERSRTEVSLTVLPPAIVERLRQRARVRSTHFSTRIEGNRLTLQEAEQVLSEGKTFRGRERDTLEVQHYFQAIAEIETWTDNGTEVSEERIRSLHALIFAGKRARPSAYRDGQNVIRDSTGGIVYLPPEAKEVPSLMRELVLWIRSGEKELPIPVVAGMAHYQFVTIHPFYDGNGRTARALATWILYRGGYDLGRFYALEEFYAQNLQEYYAALVTHPHHNYYEGRFEADLTGWLQYFLKGMAAVFEDVAQEVRRSQSEGDSSEDVLLRRLDRRARLVLGLFLRQDKVTAADAARLLGLSARQTRDLITAWVGQGWIEVGSAARKTRNYRLSAEYRRFIGEIKT
jgi:Fic family protein